MLPFSVLKGKIHRHPYVALMEYSRNYIVQTEEQYIFIYEAINEVIQSGQTEVSARNLLAHLQNLLQPINDSALTDMELEFKVIDRRFFEESLEVLLAFGEYQSSTIEIHQCE